MFRRLIALAFLGAVFAAPASAKTWTYDGVITACDPALCPLVPVAVGDPVTGSIEIDVGPSDSFDLDTDPLGAGPLLDLIDFSFLVAGVIPLDPLACDPADPACDGVILSGSGTTDADGNFDSGTLTAVFVGGTLGPLGGMVEIDLVTGTFDVTVFGGTTFVATVEGGFSQKPTTTYLYDGAITACDPALCPLVPIAVGDPVEGSIEIEVGPSESFTIDTDPLGGGPLADLVDFSFVVAGVIPLDPLDCDPADPACDGVILTGSGTTDADGNFASGMLTGTFVGGTLGPLGGTVEIDLVTGVFDVTVFGGATFVATVEGSFSQKPPITSSPTETFVAAAACNNLTMPNLVFVPGAAPDIDCTAAGFLADPGDLMFVFAAGIASCGGGGGTCSGVGATITGFTGLAASCQNTTTGMSAFVLMSDPTSIDCSSVVPGGYTEGDFITTITIGTAD